MNINDYISKIEALINSSSVVATYNLNIDRKSDEIAFISGRIDFRNGTALDFKEFIESTEKGIERYKYAYNYRKGENNIFRYDNASDPGARKTKSFPYHKHLKDDKFVDSKQVELSDILNEIEDVYIIEEDKNQ